MSDKDAQWKVRRRADEGEGEEAPAVGPPTEAVAPAPEPVETLDAVLADLDAMIGLDAVKNTVRTLISLHRVNKARVEQGAPEVPAGLHLVFTGNPGTGKTTVARIIARVYRSLGILDRGHLVEVDRGGLVAEYVGQTAPKVLDAVNRAVGGVLFIDEAYSLAPPDSRENYGAEAVATLVKAMEDRRDEFAVIVAGYPQEMHRFVESNAGLRSRFQRYIEFADYSTDELLQIFSGQAAAANIQITDEVENRVRQLFERSGDQIARGNGRFVRNLFESMYGRMALRIDADGVIEPEELEAFAPEDVPEAGGPAASDHRAGGAGYL